MKRTLIAAIMLVAAVAISCTSKEEPMPNDKGFANDGSLVYKPTATIENFVFDNATKTVVDLEGLEPTFAFADGDLLGVFPYDPQKGSQVHFSVTSIDGVKAEFDGNGYALKSGQKYAAYYPLCQEGYGDVANGVLSPDMMVKLPVDYTAQKMVKLNQFDLTADYLVANGIEPANGTCSFTMNHIGALVLLEVTFCEAGTFTEAALVSADVPFVQKGTIDLTQAEIAITPTATDTKAALALGAGFEIEKDAKQQFVMMVAPVDMDGKDLTLTFTDADSKEHSVVVAGKNFKAGKAYKITANLDEPAPAVNLSKDGTANTYIVSAAGNYYFDCTVAGNGVDGVVNLGALAASHQYPASGTCALPAGGGVRVLLNQNGCIDATSVKFEDGKIYFKATGDKGNAKLQLRDTNDDGAWVWLIWCTDEPAAITLTDASSWNYSYKVLDRNIGAITAGVDENNPENMYGMYYQFGNPHPYTSAQMINNADGGGYRMSDAIAYNDKPFKGPDYYWFNPYTSGSNALLGYIAGGGSANDGSLLRGKAAKKTIYDPCPVGYKVMPLDFLITASDAGGNVWGWYKNGTDGTLFFPYNGACLDGWGEAPGPYDPVKDEAKFCDLWQSGHAGRNMGYYFQIYAKGENRAGGGTNATKVLSYGMGVRCVADVE